MPHDEIYLLDIYKAAQWARKHVEGMTEEQFFEDVKTQDSVIRRLEMIGEAAKRISESTKSKLQEVPWKRITAMRNFLIHEYDDVDLSLVWDTVQNDLDPLINAIKPHIIQDG